MIANYLAIIAGGMLGSAHCIGMCGGFAAAISATDRPIGPILARQLLYCLGRIFTYAFLGSLAGYGGFYLSMLRWGPLDPQQILSIAAGLTMLLAGLGALGRVRLPYSWSRLLSQLVSPLYSYFLNARGWWGYFVAGLFNGLLPCGLVYSFLAIAAASGTPQHGALTMAFFGLGTVPAMVTIGCGTKLMTHHLRMRVYRVAAVLMIAFGLVTIWRGLPRETPCCEESPRLAIRQYD